MKTFSYTKINGAGNDFVLIDKKINPQLELSSEEITQICDRKKGIGADGVIQIADSPNMDFEMNYYNADGTTGSLCGNGARCAIHYARESARFYNSETHFISKGVKYSGEIISDTIIKFNLQPPTKTKLNFKVKAHNQLITSNFVDTGSPHIVIYIQDVLKSPINLNSSYEDISDFPVEIIGKEIRHLPEFQPAGVNVNFVKRTDSHLLIRSYERGVESETLACGTGAVAAAIVENLLHKKNAPIKFITKSNAELIVNFTSENNSIVNVSLTGPVEIEHKGQYSI